MSAVLVGTASWTDKTLIASGRFYPKGYSSAEARLRYYADHFPIVEVDSSYYAMPSARNAQLWAERTPDAFTFNIKAFRLLTQHQTPPHAMPPDILRALGPGFAAKRNIYYRDAPYEIRDELWRRYLDAIAPLRTSGKLGAVLFQFPPWFRASRESYEYLLEVRDRMRGHIVAVEFRHRSWMLGDQRAATLKFETDHDFVNVIVDEPQEGQNSIPTVPEVTNRNLAILRLHGRNHSTWSIRGATAASDRFNYDYTVGELDGFIPLIEKLLLLALRIHVIFNNNYEDQGQRNARTMIERLRKG